MRHITTTSAEGDRWEVNNVVCRRRRRRRIEIIRGYGMDNGRIEIMMKMVVWIMIDRIEIRGDDLTVCCVWVEVFFWRGSIGEADRDSLLIRVMETQPKKPKHRGINAGTTAVPPRRLTDSTELTDDRQNHGHTA